MPLIGINQPQRRERGPDTMERIAQALQIAQGVLGVGLTVPKYLQEQRSIKAAEKLAETKEERALRTETRQKTLFDIKITETERRQQAPSDEQYRGAEQMIKQVVPRSVIRTVGQLEDLTKKHVGAVKIQIPKRPSLFDFHKSFDEIPKDRIAAHPEAVAIELDTGEIKHGIKKGKEQQIPPERIVEQIDEIENFFEDAIKDNTLFKTNFVPVAGVFRKVFAEKFRLEDPKSAEFFAMLNSSVLDYTKSKQGSRPSDLDLKVIKTEIFPTRGDFPEVVRAKFRGIRRMLKQMIRNPNKGISEIIQETRSLIEHDIGDKLVPSFTDFSDEDLIQETDGG